MATQHTSKATNNYKLLIKKLDQFIRKFYFNKLIRGFLYTVGIILIAFLTVSLLESQFFFSTNVRKGLFYSFLGLTGLSILLGILVPLLNIFKLGPVISHKQAATIIGTHFTNVEDKLLNILQLKEQSSNLADASLIEASINQKIEDIKPVPFRKAVDLSKNKQNIKYALIPTLFLVCALFLAPNLIKDGTTRLINNDKTYEQPAPFFFTLNTPNLEVVQYEDLEVTIGVDGTVLPKEAFVHFNNFPYKLKKQSPTEFAFKFNKIQKETDFYLEANGIRSQDYTIKVIPKPIMLSFDAKLDYPDYTGQTDETLRNSGDMVVPEGTKVRWNFEAQSTDNVKIRFKGKKRISAKQKDETSFGYAKTFRKDSPYTVFLSNERLKDADSISYHVTVIPDNFPTISVQEMRDSLDEKTIYFLGEAADDYGIKNLDFNYRIEPKGATTLKMYEKIPMEVGINKRGANFTHTLDLLVMNLQPGDRASYFFEVWDNDGVNGSKSARTQTMSFELPTIDDLEEKAEQKDEELKVDMSEMMEDARELKDQAKELQQELIQKKELGWEEKSKIENMLNKHKSLQQQLQQMQENYQENLEEREEFEEFSESVKEKQEKLQKLMEEVMNPELEELFEKLQELMEEMSDKEEIMEELEDFEMDNEELEMELDRLMELFKQLEFEQKLQETIEDLQELAEEEEKLSDETEQKDGQSMHQEKRKQEDIDKKFDDIKEDMQELQKMSEELGNNQDIQSDTKEEQQKADEQMEQSMQQMQQSQGKKASKSQENAAEQMKQMAAKLQMMQMEMQMDQMEEDMAAIRQLLENLIKLSFDQEDLMDQIAESSINTPQYIDLVQKQYKLKDDSKLIEDSLVALSKRVFQLESFIMEELSGVNKNLGASIEQLEDRKVSRASTNQQFVMTGINNLALMLSEVMQQMQQQMSMQMEGDQMCNKPGSGSCNKPGGMGSAQKQLNDQIKKLQKGMKQGTMPGGQMSKEAAQLAAKQSALRQALEKLNQEQNKDGKKSMGDLEELAREMEKTEEDLVNKRITDATLKRQQKILDKLLKADQATREREMEQKREAQRPKIRERATPPEIEELLKKRKSETELYKTVPPSLRPYYKSLVEKYFKSISF